LHYKFFTLVNLTEPPLPRKEPINGKFQLRCIKLRPQNIREIQLGKSHLPQKKVANALLTTGANQQVWGWHVGGA
jgi:hypothetical protein